MSKNQIVSNEELLVSNMLELEAIRRILIQKGITTVDELFAFVEKIKIELEEKIKKNSITY